MASRTICERCLFQFRQKLHPSIPKARSSQPVQRRNRRTLQSPSTIRFLSHTSQRPSPVLETPTTPSPKPTTGPKPVASSNAPPSQNLDFVPPANAPTSIKVAQEVRRRAVGVTETYIAYGATQKLYRECAAQADYSIPQASEKDVDIPRTSTGVDTGVGEGWWYKGMYPFYP